MDFTSDYHNRTDALFFFLVFDTYGQTVFQISILLVIHKFTCLYVSFHFIAIGLYGFDDIIHNFDAFTVALLEEFFFVPPALIDAGSTTSIDRCMQRTAHMQSQTGELVKSGSLTQRFALLH